MSLLVLQWQSWNCGREIWYETGIPLRSMGLLEEIWLDLVVL